MRPRRSPESSLNGCGSLAASVYLVARRGPMANERDDEGATVVTTPAGRRLQWLAASVLVVLGLASFVFVRLSRRNDAALEAALAETRAPASVPHPAPVR